jgi:MerR family transcriptional regulator, light-induced transcriptional regulator
VRDMDKSSSDPSGERVRNTEPRFSIGEVAGMTHLSEATLRMWERRYHFPDVTRSTGRQRLYTQQAVIQLQWVQARLDEGMRTSQAIEALHQVPQGVAVATTLRTSYSPEGISLAPGPGSFQHLLLARLLAYDSVGATELLQSIASSSSPASMILELLRPTLAAIGEVWSRGEADVATEHFASHHLRHYLLDMIRASPPPFQVKPVVLACAPGELHEGGLLMLAALLRQLRWPVVYLGQSVPLPDLAMVVGPLEPALIVLVAMGMEPAEALVDWPAWLTRRVDEPFPLVGYGGRAFTENPALTERVPGVWLGQTLGEGCARIHRVLLDLNALGAS